MLPGYWRLTAYSLRFLLKMAANLILLSIARRKTRKQVFEVLQMYAINLVSLASIMITN